MNRLMSCKFSGLAALNLALAALFLPSPALAQSLFLTIDGDETIEIPIGTPPANGAVLPVQDYSGSYQGDGYLISLPN